MHQMYSSSAAVICGNDINRCIISSDASTYKVHQSKKYIKQSGENMNQMQCNAFHLQCIVLPGASFTKCSCLFIFNKVCYFGRCRGYSSVSNKQMQSISYISYISYKLQQMQWVSYSSWVISYNQMQLI